MIIKYQYFSDNQLLVTKYEGMFSSDIYKKSVDELQALDILENISAFLVDLRDLKSGKKNIVLDKLIAIRKESNFRGYKVAYIINDPKILANIQLYTDYTQSSDYQYFSTLKAALNHLDLKISVKETEDRIQKLNSIIK